MTVIQFPYRCNTVLLHIRKHSNISTNKAILIDKKEKKILKEILKYRSSVFLESSLTSILPLQSRENFLARFSAETSFGTPPPQYTWRWRLLFLLNQIFAQQNFQSARSLLCRRLLFIQVEGIFSGLNFFRYASWEKKLSGKSVPAFIF